VAKTPFLGSSATLFSANLANQQCINLYPEIVETKSGKEIGGLYMTPGLDLLTSVGSGPIKQLHQFGDHLYALSGTTIYSIATNWSSSSVGTAAGPGPWTFFDNGSNQVLIDGATAQISSGGAFGPVALPAALTIPYGGTILNGFGIISQGNDRTFYQSDLNDLTTWQTLNFSSADATADGIVAVTQLHNQLIFLKLFHIEFWVNAGNPGVAFQRLQGVLPGYGCLAPASVATLADSIMWLGLGPEGFGVVYQMSGYEPVRRSTHAIETTIQNYGDITNAIAFGYQQNGHEFYQISFPTGGTTWVLDLTASAQAGVPMWHQRAAWTGSAFARHPAATFALFNNKIVVGDYANGNIYAYNPYTQTDAGSARRWLRSWRALKTQVAETHKVRQLEIEYEPGVNVTGTPNMNLRQSFDGGAVWSSTKTATAGASGQTQKRVRFRNLGMKPRGMTADRIFELSSTDPMLVSLMGGEIT
jgi:hypothetical protein